MGCGLSALTGRRTHNTLGHARAARPHSRSSVLLGPHCPPRRLLSCAAAPRPRAECRSRESDAGGGRGGPSKPPAPHRTAAAAGS
ncbi:Neurobeachin [Manis javanica]|nr:Neurobeachin [Manis javanica]